MSRYFFPIKYFPQADRRTRETSTKSKRNEFVFAGQKFSFPEMAKQEDFHYYLFIAHARQTGCIMPNFMFPNSFI
jgi:hypothetical protein